MLHRASMKYYEDYLKKHGFTVKYCEFKTKPKYKDAYMFDCIDKIEIDDVLEVLETPAFMLTKKQYSEYKEKKKEVNIVNNFNWK